MKGWIYPLYYPHFGHRKPVPNAEQKDGYGLLILEYSGTISQ